VRSSNTALLKSFFLQKEILRMLQECNRHEERAQQAVLEASLLITTTLKNKMTYFTVLRDNCKECLRFSHHTILPKNHLANPDSYMY